MASNKVVRFLVVLLMTLWLPGLGAQTPEKAHFVVSPDGRDSNPGTLAQPFASLDQARLAVRQLQAQSDEREILVLLRGGIYRVEKPVVFGPEDSGPEGGRIVYAAYPGEKPVFSAGRPVGPFRVRKDGLWEADLPSVAAGQWYFEQLYVNGRLATRARTPNAFYYFMQSRDLPYQNPETGEPIESERERLFSFFYRNRDLQMLASTPPEELEDVTAVVYFDNWVASRHRLASLNAATRMVHLIPHPSSIYNLYSFQPAGKRYYMENVRAALDVPGEWYLSRKGRLLYMPLHGETPEKATVIAPVAKAFVHVAGSPEAGTVRNLSFKGLTFQHAGYVLPKTGMIDVLAAESVPATIWLDYAERVLFEKCAIAHIGSYGIWFRQNSHNCTIRQSYLHDLGAGGVRIGQTGQDDPDTGSPTGEIKVENCIIRSGGRLHAGAVGILVGHSGGNVIEHNEVADFYYSGISLGWRWDNSNSLATQNHVAWNRVHHIGQGLLNDLGGIYLLGRSPQTEVKNNVIFDVYSRAGKGWGIFCDSYTAEVLIEQNLVYDTTGGGLHVYDGMDLDVSNNIFAFGQQAQVMRTRKAGMRFARNIVYYDQGFLFAGQWEDDAVTLENNVYWKTSGQPVSIAGDSLAKWQAEGHDAGSIMARPLFQNVSRRRFGLLPGSPAEKVGFETFAHARAGVFGDAEWVALVDDYNYPPLRKGPARPALEVQDGFEHRLTGTAPSHARLHLENRGDSITITREAASRSRQSLQITDAPNLSLQENPKLLFLNLFREGQGTRVAYDVLVEDKTHLVVAWNSAMPGRPTYQGPRLELKGGKALLPNAETWAFPVGKWVRFQMDMAGPGSAGGTWTLTATTDGKSRRWEGLPVVDEAFRGLDFLAIMSMADVRTTVYLDNLTIMDLDTRAEDAR